MTSSIRRFVAQLATRIRDGALLGAAVGAICLVVGLARAALFLVSGGRIAGLTAADIREMVLYILGFTAAGTLVGAVWPLLQRRFAMYLGFALGGSLVGIAITLGEASGKSPALSDWVIGITVGATMGCAFAYGWRKTPS